MSYACLARGPERKSLRQSNRKAKKPIRRTTLKADAETYGELQRAIVASPYSSSLFERGMRILKGSLTADNVLFPRSQFFILGPPPDSEDE